jgi:uncharacterized protein (TIGR04255 family)
MTLPRALKHDAILECAVEMRFSPIHESAETLIPGIVFSASKGKFSKSTPLPSSQLPKVLRDSQPHLTYVATTALESSDFKLMLGGRTAIVSFTKPYAGWSEVSPIILDCFRSVLDTALVKDVERISMKYINVIGGEERQHDISQLQVEVKLNGFDLRGPGTQLRGETEIDGCTTIIEVQSGITVTIKKESESLKTTGVGLYIDTIKAGPFPKAKDDLPAILEHLHNTSKQVFFGLLETETLKSLGPTYD